MSGWPTPGTTTTPEPDPDDWVDVIADGGVVEDADDYTEDDDE
jgi:hypothetical protein